MASSSFALTLSADASERVSPRSSSTSPLVMCVGLLVSLFNFFFSFSSVNPAQNLLEPLPRRVNIASVGLSGLFLKAVQNVNHIPDPRQIHDSIPSAIIGFFQLPDALSD